jgi:carbonic anhydrase/acetyltransferase-like protein (isoleucine patch superfamily)
MPIYALADVEPSIDPSAFVHPDAVVIGDVRIGPESSIWPAAVLRADGGPIVIGARSNVQDGSVLHVSPETPTTVGDDVLIGHLAHLEGCTVRNGAFIGTGSLVLHRVVVGEGAVVAGNAVVLDDTEVPAGALAVGIPAQIRVGGARPGMGAAGSRSYVETARRYRADLRRIG